MHIIIAAWRVIRALVTLSDSLHWIKKYDAAKWENKRLRRQARRRQRQPGTAQMIQRVPKSDKRRKRKRPVRRRLRRSARLRKPGKIGPTARK